MLYAEKSVQEKITYFDENTGIGSVYILPVTLGVFFALGQPWLTYVGAWVAKFPKLRLHSLQNDIAEQKSSREIRKIETFIKEESIRAKLEAAKEQRQIEAAKRLEEAKGIGDRQIADDIIKERSKEKNTDQSGIKAKASQAEISTSMEYLSPAMNGTVKFDYSDNNGKFVVGTGDMCFETHWADRSRTSIYAYSDGNNIDKIAVAKGIENISNITNAESNNFSSSHRTFYLGDICIWKNTDGYYLATRIEALESRSDESEKDSITFSYVIDKTKSGNFSGAASE